jgi:CheY-like chemotaxis protein
MRDPVILIVDDEEDILALTRVLCKDLACTLHTATSGEKALELAESLDTLDVIVADLHMNGMDGIEFLRRVRRLFPDAVRVLHSGRLEIDVVNQLMEEGLISRAVQKPVPPTRAKRNLNTLVRLIRAGMHKQNPSRDAPSDRARQC